jgi:hypothetical protein
VDIPGVHTKFIEAHRGVLAELLDIVLPPEAIDPTVSGATRFAKRYGFREKPVRIRFRILDPQCAILSCRLAQDITLDSESFVRLSPDVTRVFITENEINFLAFPEVKESLVIFGAGYGFDTLGEAEWLKRCRIYYWGDIDTHGFAILDQLRSCFDNVESFLMDRSTLLAFEAQWGGGRKTDVARPPPTDRGGEGVVRRPAGQPHSQEFAPRTGKDRFRLDGIGAFGALLSRQFVETNGIRRKNITQRKLSGSILQEHGKSQGLLQDRSDMAVGLQQCGRGRAAARKDA